MAREYGKVPLNVWGNEEWLDLSGPEKLLYVVLLCHQTLTYAGVADWRPKRLARLVDATWTAADVEAVGDSLQRRHMIVIDREVEEVLIRTFIKWDGVLKQPRLAVSMVSAFAGITSRRLKQVVAFEVQKLRSEQPELSCWGDQRMQVVLDHTGLDVKVASPEIGPSLPVVSATFGANDDRSLVSPTSTATTTTTSSKEDIPSANAESPQEKTSRGTRITEDWRPLEADFAAMQEQCPGYDLEREHLNFIGYWLAKPGKEGLKINWSQTWRNWMRRNYDRLPHNERQELKKRSERIR